MKRNKKLILGSLVAVTLIAAALFSLNSRTSDVEDKSITGTVNNVINIPDQSKDGYYGIRVKAVNGQEYTINASGVAGTTESQDKKDLQCVDVPRVKAGDKVSFLLPKSETAEDANTFDTCYQKNVTTFFFRVQ